MLWYGLSYNRPNLNEHVIRFFNRTDRMCKGLTPEEKLEAVRTLRGASGSSAASKEGIIEVPDSAIMMVRHAETSSIELCMSSLQPVGGLVANLMCQD